MMKSEKQILILGGGFAGVEAAIQLRKKKLNVVLVSDRDFLFIYPTSIWVPVRKRSLSQVKISLTKLAAIHGFNLIIEGDTILKMSKNSYIMLENGSVKFKGTIDKPIKIIPLENEQKWNGIYVNSSSISNNTSILKHVKISGISYFDNGKIQLTGGLNFINSNIDISNSLIEKSFSEDAINIVNSKFKIDGLYIENSKSDGIDIDFGEGEIINASFNDIGGDAIDLSGSDVILRNIVASRVYDKAISAGEQTLVNINGLKISSSRIGIASKDSSIVKGSNINISECGLFDFAVFQKKQ